MVAPTAGRAGRVRYRLAAGRARTPVIKPRLLARLASVGRGSHPETGRAARLVRSSVRCSGARLPLRSAPHLSAVMCGPRAAGRRGGCGRFVVSERQGVLRLVSAAGRGHIGHIVARDRASLAARDAVPRAVSAAASCSWKARL